MQYRHLKSVLSINIYLSIDRPLTPSRVIRVITLSLLSRISKLPPKISGGRSHFSLKFWASLNPECNPMNSLSENWRSSCVESSSRDWCKIPMSQGNSINGVFIWYIVSSMSMLQTRNVTSFLLGQVDVVHRRSKIGAASTGLIIIIIIIIIIIDECKNPKYIKHV